MAKASPEYQCHHIHDNGQRCGSMRMKRRQFCYYHLQLHRNWVLPGQSLYQPPPLDNPHSISIALSHVMIAQSKRTISPIEIRKYGDTPTLEQTMRAITEAELEERDTTREEQAYKWLREARNKALQRRNQQREM